MDIEKVLNMLQDVYIFLIKLKIQIKLLPEEKFKKLIGDKSLDYTQRLYLWYFRYM